MAADYMGALRPCRGLRTMVGALASGRPVRPIAAVPSAKAYPDRG
jgi:hypothetical protein